MGCHFLLQEIFLTQGSNPVSCIAVRFYPTELPRKLPTILAAAAAASRQSCLTLCDPIDGSPSGSQPHRQVPRAKGLRGPRLETAAAAAESLQSCPTLCDHIDGSPPGSTVPGIFQARVTGVGCHFLLQCTKVKSESEVAQSCLTPSDLMGCPPPGSPVPGILQARTLEWVAIAFSSAGR